MTDIELGERYYPDELPDSTMTPDGNLEQVNSDTYAMMKNGKVYEFNMVVECKMIGELSANGGVNVLEELRGENNE